MVLGGLCHRILRRWPLPVSHELSLSHILWAEASADVPVMLSPPAPGLNPDIRQPLPLRVLGPQSSLAEALGSP